MQCKSCGTELPKKAKICPKCGAISGETIGKIPQKRMVSRTF